MSRVTITLLLTFCLYNMYGQQLFNAKSKIIVTFNGKQQAYFEHKLVKGQGVKGLPQVVKKTAKEILEFNGINTEKPVFKDEINVPLNLSLLVKSDKERLAKKSNVAVKVPVYYKVRKGETVFKIAKTYNDEDVDQFIARNNLKNSQVKPGMEVLLGWLPIAKTAESTALKPIENNIKPMKKIGVKDEKMLTDKKAISKKDEALNKTKINLLKVVEKDTMKKVVLTPEEEELKAKAEALYVTTKGVAIWQQSHKKNSNKFVLHDKAAINSTILLYNPMAKKSIAAKVIGRIPQETYHDDVDIVLSSGAANSLGALDTRFMIEMKYKNH
jgi:LysM repeat protein